MNYSRGLPWSADEDDYLCEMRSDQVPFATIAARITDRFGKTRTKVACIARWWVIEKDADLALAKAQAAMALREQNRRERVEVPARLYVPETPWPAPRKASDDPEKVRNREKTRRYRERCKAALSVAMDPKPAPMVVPAPRSRHYTVSWT